MKFKSTEEGRFLENSEDISSSDVEKKGVRIDENTCEGIAKGSREFRHEDVIFLKNRRKS